MNYKVRFQPQEHLGPKGWERFDAQGSEGLASPSRRTVNGEGFGANLRPRMNGCRRSPRSSIRQSLSPCTEPAIAFRRHQSSQGTADHRDRRAGAHRRHPADPPGRGRSLVDPDAADRHDRCSRRSSSGRSGARSARTRRASFPGELGARRRDALRPRLDHLHHRPSTTPRRPISSSSSPSPPCSPRCSPGFSWRSGRARSRWSPWR